MVFEAIVGLLTVTIRPLGNWLVRHVLPSGLIEADSDLSVGVGGLAAVAIAVLAIIVLVHAVS